MTKCILMGASCTPYSRSKLMINMKLRSLMYVIFWIYSQNDLWRDARDSKRQGMAVREKKTLRRRPTCRQWFEATPSEFQRTTMRFGKKGCGSHEVTVDTGRGMGDAGPCNNAAERTLRTTDPHSMIQTPEKRKRDK